MRVQAVARGRKRYKRCNVEKGANGQMAEHERKKEKSSVVDGGYEPSQNQEGWVHVS